MGTKVWDWEGEIAHSLVVRAPSLLMELKGRRRFYFLLKSNIVDCDSAAHVCHTTFDTSEQEGKMEALTCPWQSRALPSGEINDPITSLWQGWQSLYNVSPTWDKSQKEWIMCGQAIGADCCRLCGPREICNSNSRWHSLKTKISLQGEMLPGLWIWAFLQGDPVYLSA